MAGLLVGFLGVVVLLGFDAPRSGLEWIGVGCMLLAVPAYALAPLVIQRFLHGAEGLGSSAASLAIAALVLSPADLRFLPPSVPFVRAITCLIALGAYAPLGMLLYFFLIKLMVRLPHPVRHRHAFARARYAGR
jgi:hypothetical protein